MATGWAGVPNGIAIYAKIASILRSQIASGQLAVGARLPSIEQMSEIYRVAPVTIRLAVRLLVGEGLLSSQRGRGTFVTGGAGYPGFGGPPDEAAGPARSAVSAQVIHRSHVDAVPEDLRFGHRSVGGYEWVTRLYSLGGRTCFVMDAFVCDELSRTLPSDMDARLMIPDLLREEFLAREAEVLTTVTVAAADMEIAGHLGCDLSHPVARIARVFADPSGRILVSSKATYRADYFHMQTRQPVRQFLASRSPSSVRVTD